MLHDEGQPIEVGGSRALLLNDCESAWLVTAGRVDVFAVHLHEGEAVGSRYHLFRAESGQALFGVKSGAGGMALLARALPDAVLLRLPRARLRALGGDAVGAGEVIPLVEGWVSGLSAGVARGVPPTRHSALEAGRTLALTARGVARPQSGVVWVSHQEGSSFFLGNETLAPLTGSGFFPMAPTTWLLARDAANLQTSGTGQVLAQDPDWLCLECFHDQALACIVAHAEQEMGAERARLTTKLASDRLYVENAVTRLASVLRQGATDVFLGDDIGDDVEEPLVSACRLVGDALGVPMHARPDPIDGRPEPQTLEGIAQASRVRVRQVALRTGWWEQDNGPLLGFMEEGQRPVALIPLSPRRYELRDPVERHRTPVTPEVAEGLAPFAHTFYRTFPERPLTGWDLVRHGLPGNHRDLATVALTGLAGGALGLVTPIATGLIFDSLIPAAERGQLLALSVALIASALATAAFRITRSIAVLRVEGRMDTVLQAAVWDRLLSLPLPFFRDYATGDLAGRAMGINAIRQTLTGATLATVLAAAFSLLSFALLFAYSVPLAGVATLLVLAYAALTGAAGLAQLRYQRAIAQKDGRLAGMVLQFLTGIAKLRVAGAEGRAFARWADEFSDKQRVGLRARQIANRVAVLNAVYPVVAALLIFLMVALSGGAGLSTGEFLAFNTAFLQVMTAMLAVTANIISMLGVVPLYERSRPILAALPEVAQARADPGDLTGEIEVSHVSFRYTPDGPLTLKNVSLHVRPGEFVAIVGPSGSGKSTLFRLLLGFERPEAGALYYNGHDLGSLDMRLVRRRIGVVLQHGKLMPGDILTNIIGATGQATADDAWDAARMAGLDEDIKRMPMGMNTVLSEGASTLSGGQRQRLLIARAIVHKPRILFFDEATSALDNRTQAIVSESLEGIRATRLAIAHRLSTIIKADRIIVVDNGQIVQEGHYSDLVQQPGLFAELVQRQMV